MSNTAKRFRVTRIYMVDATNQEDAIMKVAQDKDGQYLDWVGAKVATPQRTGFTKNLRRQVTGK